MRVASKVRTNVTDLRREERPPHLSNLTAARFIAALFVVLYHVRTSLPHFRVTDSIFAAGYVGVSFFFVLSGFVLAYNHDPARIGRAHFWANRFARIFPVY